MRCPPDRGELMDWLAGADLAEPTIGPQPTFAAFSARKPLAPHGGQIVTTRGAKIT